MPRDFYPRPEADIVSFTRNFSRQTLASWERWNLREQQVVDYAAVQAQFEAAYHVVQCAGTKTKVTVGEKDTLKRSLERATRALAGPLRMNADVTPADRISLGIPQLPYKGARVPTPVTTPFVLVTSVVGRRIELQLVDSASPHRKAVAKGSSGGMVVAFVGDGAPPENPKLWPYRVLTSRSKVTLELRHDVPPGARVLIVARWDSPTMKPGPWGRVITAYLQGGPAVSRPRLAQAA
jgi:hypothetical protein